MDQEGQGLQQQLHQIQRGIQAESERCRVLKVGGLRVHTPAAAVAAARSRWRTPMCKMVVKDMHAADGLRPGALLYVSSLVPARNAVSLRCLQAGHLPATSSSGRSRGFAVTRGSTYLCNIAVSCTSSESLCGLQERAQQNFEVTMGISTHEVTLDQLARQIAEVYEQCGFDRDVSMSTLQMLTNIEVSLGPAKHPIRRPQKQRHRNSEAGHVHMSIGECCPTSR